MKNKYLKNSSVKFIYLIIFSLLFALPTYSQSPVGITFNDINDLTIKFNPSTAATYSNVAAGGLWNTGMVQMPLGATEVWTMKQGLDVTGSAVYKVSAFFRIGGNSGYSGIGFTTSNSNEPDGTYGNPSECLGVSFHGGGAFFVNNTATTGIAWTHIAGDLAISNWYKMIYTITDNGDGTFNEVFEIYESDVNGVNGALKTSNSQTMTMNLELSAAPKIYPYFSNSGSRADAMDNMGIEGPPYLTPKNTLDFDGVDDFVNLGNAPEFEPTAELTLELWAYKNSWANIGLEKFISNTETGGYNIMLDNGILRSEVRANGVYQTTEFDAATLSAGWHHIAVTFDGQYAKMYVDGYLKSTADAGGVYPITYNANTCTFLGTESSGVCGTAGEYFTGQIDEVRIWNIARTETDLQQNMWQPLDPVLETNLTAYYNFNEMQGTILNDLKGVNNGTLYNMTNDDWITSYAMKIPTIITTTETTPVVNTPIVVEIDFQTEVSGFTISDILITGGTASNFNDLGGGAYQIDVVAPEHGTVSINIAENVCSSTLTGASNLAGELDIFIPPGNALNFDGGNNYVSIPYNATLKPANLTFETWIYPDGLNSWDIVYSSDGGTWSSGFMVYYNSAYGGLIAAFDSYSTDYVSTELQLGKWHHVAVTYDATSFDFKMYLNGVLADELNFNQTQSYNTNAPSISDATYCWQGYIDEVRLWNTVRTNEEIRTYMHQPLAGTETGLLAYYNFDQTSGTTLPDITGNGNKGTLTNMDGATDWTASDAMQPPTVITTYEDFPTVNSPIPVEVEFYTEVTGFTMSDINVPNGVVSDFADLGFGYYTFNVTATEHGVVSIDIPSAVCSSVAYNQPNLAGELDIFIPPGNALIFDGTDDRIDLTTLTYNPTSPFSAELWFKPQTTTGIMLAQLTGTATDGRNIIALGSSKLGNNVTGSNRYGTTDIAVGEWHHAAVTYDGTTMKYFLNGILEMSVNAATISANGSWRIGASKWPSDWYQGDIDEVRIWNDVRTEAEIREYMTKPVVPASEPNLLAYYNFDQTSGTILPDLKGSNDGTLEASMTDANWIASEAMQLPTTITTYEDFPTVNTPIPIEVEFYTETTGFSESDINITNATFVGGSFTNLGNRIYSFEVTSDNHGIINIDIPANVCSSLAYNQPNLTGELDIFIPPGNAIAFDGFNSQTVQNSTVITVADNVTLECWVKAEGSGDTNNEIPLYVGESAANGYGIYIRETDRRIGIMTGGAGYTFTNISLPDNQWTHLAITRNAGLWTMYINGIETALDNPSITTIAPNDLLYVSHSFNRFPGLVDEVRFWNDVRTADEIRQTMVKPLTGTESNLLIYYNFDETGGELVPNIADTDAGLLTGTILPVWTASDAMQPPTVINAAYGTHTSTNPVPVTVNFYTEVAGFTPTAITVNNGVLDNFTSTDSKVYSFNITGSNLGNITISIDANVCSSVAYNQPNMAATYSIEYAQSLGNALDFDGVNDIIAFGAPNDIPIGNSNYTIEAWFNVTQMGDNGIIGWGKYGVANQVNGLRIYADGITHYWWANDLIIPTGDISNKWHHIAVSFDGLTRAMYLDGKLIGSDTPTGHIVPYADNITIGVTNNNEYFEGKLDEIRIWNTARTANQIKNNRYNYLSGNETGLVAYYRFDQGLPTADNTLLVNELIDYSGNCNSGTLTNFARTGTASNWVETGNPEAPIVTTDATTSITKTSATLNAKIFIVGESNVTIRGFCYSTEMCPTVANSTVGESGSFASGVYSLAINNLTQGTTYYIRAFASNTQGTSYGETQTFTTPAFLPLANVLDFDGDGDTFSNSTIFATAPTDFTIEWWLYPRTHLDHNQHLYADYGVSGWDAFSFHTDATGGVFVGTDGANRLTPTELGAGTVTPDKWQHFAFVYNSTTSKGYFYKDGILLAAKFMLAPVAWNGLKTDASTSYSIDGKIDELRVWKTARTSAQIQASMFSYIQPNEPQWTDLEAYYRFDQGVTDANNTLLVNEIVDYSGNCNTASTTGFARNGTTSNWTSEGNPEAPIVTTYAPTSVTRTSATFNAEIFTEGETNVTKRGFCFSKSPCPTTADNIIEETGIFGTGIYSFTTNDIEFGNTYYVRAYATNAQGTSYGETQTFTTDGFLPLGNALDFDGVDDYVYAPNTPQLMNDFTVSAWINTSSATSSDHHGIASLDGSWYFKLVGTDKLWFTIKSGSDYALPIPTLSTNKWYHVTLVKQGSTVYYYLNGKLVGTSVLSSGIVLSSSGIMIGRTEWGEYFNGKLDEVRYWDIARTKAEIQQDMFSYITKLHPQRSKLAAYYSFDQGIAGGDNSALPIEQIDYSDNCYKAYMYNFFRNGTTSNHVHPGNPEAPILTTYTATAVSVSGATFNGEIITDGESDVTTRGFCYSTSMCPTVADNTIGTSGNFFTHTFSETVTGLLHNTTYYVRAFATNAQGTSYGETQTFTTQSFVPMGNALDFDGNNDEVTVANNGDFDFADGTFEAWVMPNWVNGTNGYSPTIMSIRRTSARYSIHIEDNKNKISLWNGTDFTAYPYTFTSGIWYHIALVETGTSAEIYINGIHIGTMFNAINTTATGQPFNIGNSTYGEYFKGTIDEVRVWNKPLSQAEIQSNMYNYLSGKEDGLVAYYRFDQGIANGDNSSLINEVIDYSDNCNKGALNGFTLNGTTSNWTHPGNPEAPIVTTNVASNVQPTSATFNAKILTEGETTVTERGFCYAMHSCPTMADNTVGETGSFAAGTYSLPVTGLTAENIYYVRAFIKNAQGTTFGETYKFTTFIPLGNTLNMIGATDYISGTNSTFPTGNSDRTAEMWVKIHPASPDGIIFNYGNSNYTGARFGLAMQVNGTLSFWGHYTDFDSNSKINDGVWHHLAVTYSGGIVKIYIDGVLESSISASLSTAAGTDFTIGYSPSYMSNLEAEIDELRIWDYVRTETEIQADMFSYIPDTHTNWANLSAYYRFDQGVAAGDNTTLPNEVIDYTGNCNKGTLTDFALTGTTSNWTHPGNPEAPIITSLPVSNVAGNTAVFNAEIFNIGETDITERGFLYSETPCFDLTTATVINETGTYGSGSFSLNANALLADKIYYVRAFAKNSNGTSLGETVMFDTYNAPGNALVFDGINDYIRVPDSDNLTLYTDGINDELTIEAWIKPEALSGHQIIAAKRFFSSGEYQLGIMDNMLKITFMQGSGSYDVFTTNVTIETNEWQHVAVTFNDAANEVKFFVNGRLRQTVSVPSNVHIGANSNSDFSIGATSNYSEYLMGEIDEVRVWDVALSWQQIKEMMHRQIDANFVNNSLTDVSNSVDWTNLRAYYNFNEADGTNTITDHSAYTNGGTLQLMSGTEWKTSGAMCPFFRRTTNITPDSFTLNWRNVDNATSYLLDVSTDPTFNTIDIQNNTSIPQGVYSFNVSGMQVNSTYYSRLRAITDWGVTPNSDTLQTNTRQPSTLLSTIKIDADEAKEVILAATFSYPTNPLNFTATDISATNCSIEEIINSGDNLTYFLKVKPEKADGCVVWVKESSYYSASNPVVFYYEPAPPVGEIALDATSPTNSATVPVYVWFDEEMKGFESTDILISNGNLNNFEVFGNNQYYKATITAINNSLVAVEVPANVCSNTFDMPNSKLSLTYVFDDIPPEFVFTPLTTDKINSPSASFRIDFSEKIVGLSSNNLLFSSGSGILADVVEDGNTYYFDIENLTVGEIHLEITNQSITDLAGNQCTSTATYTILYDNQKPVPLISWDYSSPTFRNPLDFTIDFGEEVIGFDTSVATSQFQLSGGAISSITYTGVVGKYRVIVTPETDLSTIKLHFIKNQVSDLSGNQNDISNKVEVQYDAQNLVPEISFDNISTEFINYTPALCRVVFNKSIITGFNSNDISATNAAISGFSNLGGGIYTFELTPQQNGLVTVETGANVCSDATNSANIASGQLQFIFDDTDPQPSLSVENAAFTNQDIKCTLNFGEAVNGFERADLTVDNGFIFTDLVQTTESIYSFKVKAENNGVVSIALLANSFTDLAGNANTTATMQSVVFDNSSPQTLITSLLGSPLNQRVIRLYIDFGEVVNGFTSQSVSSALINASLLSFDDSNRTNGKYNVEIEADTEGIVQLNIPENTCTDKALNHNTAASFSIQYDATPPETLISSSSAPYTISNLVQVDVNFTEFVKDFTMSDIMVSNGAVQSLSADGTSYYLTVSIENEGLCEISVANNKFADVAGNENTIGAVLSIIYDKIRPQTLISSSLSSPTNQTEIPLNIEFGEPVSGFTSADVADALSNATLTAFMETNSTNGQFYIEIQPTANGVVQLALPENCCTDRAQKPNTAANFSILFDETPPQLSFSSSATPYTTNSQVAVDVIFSENVKDFTQQDIVLNNATIQNFGGSGTLYYLLLNIGNEGLTEIDVHINSFADMAGNSNQQPAYFSTVYDATIPVPSIHTSENAYTYQSEINISVNFGEDVPSFNSNDLVLNNAAINSFTGANGVYTFNLTPVQNGETGFSIPQGATTDKAGLHNASAAYQIVFDNISPEASIAGLLDSPTNNALIPLNITLTEKVTGFTATDLLLTNCTLSSFYGSDTQYYAFVEPLSAGIVKVEIAPASISDNAVNTNLLSAAYEIEFDNIPPQPVITSTSTSPTRENPVVFNVDFGETIFGFNSNALVIEGGTLSTVSQSEFGQTFTFSVVPSDDNVQIKTSIPAYSVIDAAGNQNVLSNIKEIEYDANGIYPVISFVDNQLSSPLNIPEFDLEIKFSKPITWTGTERITVENAVYEGFTHITDNPTSIFRVTIKPKSNGTVKVTVPANIAKGAAGAYNYASDDFVVVFDVSQPAPTIVRLGRAVSNQNPLYYNILFNEEASNFEMSHLEFTGILQTHILTEVSPAVYSLEVIPLENGEFSFRLPGNSFTDFAGNYNKSSETIKTVYDNVRPQPQLDLIDIDTQNEFIKYNVDFGEQVYDFDSNDINTGNMAGTIVITALSETKYAIELTDLLNGNITVEVMENSCTDAAGNGNYPVSDTEYFNSESPTVKLDAHGIDRTNLTSIPIEINFSEEVTGFEQSDIELNNCTFTNFKTNVEGRSYTILAHPVNEGHFTVHVPANSVENVLNVANLASNMIDIIYTKQGPEPVISTDVTEVTNQQKIEVVVDFGTSIDNFDSNKIAIANTKTTLVSGASGRYDFVIEPQNNGLVTIDVPANEFTDLAGNTNVEGAYFEFVFDDIPPVHEFISTEGAYSNKNSVEVELNFSEKPFGFTADLIEAQNCRISNITKRNDLQYFLNIEPLVDGKAQIELGEATYTDEADNTNISSAVWSVIFDRVRPRTSLYTNAESIVNYSPVNVFVDFGEKLAAFDTNGIATGSDVDINKVEDGVYEFTFKPETDNLLKVEIPSGKAYDFAGNTTLETAVLTIEFDNSQPEMLFSGVQYTNKLPVTVSIEFTEPVFGFEMADIVNNSTTSELITLDKTHVALKLWPEVGEEEIKFTMDIANGAFTDKINNPNKAATHWVVYDIVRPQPTVYTYIEKHTDTYPMPVMVDFGETVNVEDINTLFDIEVPLELVNSDGGIYTFLVSPEEDGEYTFRILENTVSDLAGNMNLPSNELTLILDRVRPTIEIKTLEDFVYTVDTVIPMQIKFSEAVINFDSNNVSFDGAQVEGWTDLDVGLYSFNLIPGIDATNPINSAFAKTYQISVAEGIVNDLTQLPNVRATYDVRYQTFQSPCLSHVPELNWFTPLVRVDCNITITENQILVVQPGVTVEFAENCTLTVNGKMNIKGEIGNGEQVLFTANGDKTWGGITISSTEDFISNLSHFTVEKVASATQCAIRFDNQSVVRMNNFTIQKNSGVSGAAIHIAENASIEIKDAVIQHNTANGNGVVSVNNMAELNMHHTIIRNNTATDSGGAVYLTGQSSININNCLIVNNTANAGGGIFVDNKETQIVSSTIAQNMATSGNELHIENADLFHAENSIFWNRTQSNVIQNNSGKKNLFAYCLIPTDTESRSNFYNNHNIDANPQFDNIAETAGSETVNIIAGWSLQNTSPCVNAGNSVADTYEAVTDIYGNIRIYNNTRIDIGAAESNMEFSYTDFVALGAIYDALSANTGSMAGWHNKSADWLTNNPVSSIWYGVETLGGRVSEINLPNLDIEGTLPDEFCMLTFLQTIDIHGNKFTSTIPQKIYQLVEIENIRFNNNQFEGVVLQEFGELLNLSVLDLGSNNFSGNMPEILSTLNGLEVLDISNNDIVDLPYFGQKENLFLFAAQNNKLTFEDLEINIKVAPNFAYTPQQKIHTPLTLKKELGQTVELNSITGGENNFYQWYKDGILIAGATNGIYTFEMTNTTNGSYYCKITNTDVQGLTLEREPIEVILYAELPLPDVIVPQRYCVGDNPVSLSVNNLPYSNAIVVWNINGKELNGESIRFEVNNSAFVSVQYKLAQNESPVFTFNIDMRPELTYENNMFEVAGIQDNDEYIWFYEPVIGSDDVTKLTETGSSIDVSSYSSGYFRLRVKTENGCSAISNYYTYNGSEITAITNNTVAAIPVKVYPNPANGKFNVEVANNQSGIYRVEIFNANGKLLQYRTINKSEGIYEKFEMATKGIYFIKLLSKNGIEVEKVVIY